jgi:deoxyhypusine synthase
MTKKYDPINFKNVKTCSLKLRKSKFTSKGLAKPFASGSFKGFLKSLPDVLASRDFRKIVAAIIRAKRKDRPVVMGMGAHPIKTGLTPVITDLMKKGVITAIAMNGACIIHDYEMALIGRTSEDVDTELCRGTFGMAEETGKGINQAIKEGISEGKGIGKAVGDRILKGQFPYKKLSVLAAASRLGIPATVHVAIGTDIIHMHPETDGRVIGEGSIRDFRIFTSVISNLKGGVYINLGSAVIMPEVFLKAFAVSRNLGYNVKNFTTVNMDFFQHYRCRENVLRRPVFSGGNSYSITGHHEIMFPLLASAVLEELKHK